MTRTVKVNLSVTLPGVVTSDDAIEPWLRDQFVDSPAYGLNPSHVWTDGTPLARVTSIDVHEVEIAPDPVDGDDGDPALSRDAA